jgi:CIC family chloride channel protein
MGLLASLTDGLRLARSTLRRAARRFLIVFIVLSGAVCGLVAVAFHATLAFAEQNLLGRVLESDGLAAVLGRLLLPAVVGVALGFLVPRVCPGAAGGLALVRTAYARQPSVLDARSWLGTFLATPLSLGSGAPLGPEGPTVVLTSGTAVLLARLAGLPRRAVRGMIPVGTAAGIAAIFNTPITGVVFALEEVIGTASRGLVGGAIVAAVAAAVVQKQAQGGAHLLPAHPATWHAATELLGFAWLGLACGVMSGLLPRLVHRLRAMLRRWPVAAGPHAGAIRGGAAGLLVGVLGFARPEALGVGYPTVALYLAGGGDAAGAALAFTVKLAIVTASLAAPLLGGVFAPSLFLGASLGSATGHLLALLFPGQPISPGAYALVGMGAFFAGFLRTPLSAVLIVFELTGDYTLVAPLMLAVALSTLVSKAVSPATLVEAQLEQDGVPVEEPAGDPLAGLRVRDAMSPDVVWLPAHTSVLDAWNVAWKHTHRAYPLADAEGRLVGMVESEALDDAVRAGRWEDAVGALGAPALLVAEADAPLDRVSLRLAAANTTRCPVVDRPGGRIVGFLAASDLLRVRYRASLAPGPEDLDPLGTWAHPEPGASGNEASRTRD